MLPADPTGRGLVRLAATDGPRSLGDVDVVFPVLHGPFGEDGTIQGLLEMAGIPYVGANVFASAAAMDKEFTKKLAMAEGIPVGPYAVLRPGVSLRPAQDKERLGLPVFVKPARAGSSHGITKVSDWAKLDDAVAIARAVDPKVLVEAAIDRSRGGVRRAGGGVGRGAEASVLAEVRVVSGHEFYDFEAKYLDDVLRVRHPGDAARRDHPPDSGVRLPDVYRVRLRRTGSGGLLRPRRWPDLPQRDQHHARLHLDVDVSADVGGQRTGVPEAGRPADRDRAGAASGASALAARDWTGRPPIPGRSNALGSAPPR